MSGLRLGNGLDGGSARLSRSEGSRLLTGDDGGLGQSEGVGDRDSGDVSARGDDRRGDWKALLAKDLDVIIDVAIFAMSGNLPGQLVVTTVIVLT